MYIFPKDEVLGPCRKVEVVRENILRKRGAASVNSRDVSKCSYPKQVRGLPWWHSGQESACQCRGHGFEPWSGKIPHAMEQLNPYATTTEPALWSLRDTTTEARVPQLLKPAHREPVLHNEKTLQ